LRYTWDRAGGILDILYPICVRRLKGKPTGEGHPQFETLRIFFHRKIGNNILAESDPQEDDGDGPAPWLPDWLSALSGIPEDRRRKRLLVMVQGYIDESGSKGQGEVFVFSAIAAKAKLWARVADAWDACLKEPPSIRYFKMDEAAGCTGEFFGLSKPDRDIKLKALCKIINNRALLEMSCVMVLKDFEELWAPRLGRPATEPYFIPFQIMCSAIAAEVCRVGIKDKCEIYFDENMIFGPRAKVWYPVLKRGFPAEYQAVMPVEPFFRSDADVLPLQAADLTAWMARTANENEGGSLGEFDWLWDELCNLARSEISQVLDSEWIKESASGKMPPNEEMLKAYREVFGFDWPPKNTIEKRRHRGRK
jgi:Protein of unknown function (DUF3800)